MNKVILLVFLWTSSFVFSQDAFRAFPGDNGEAVFQWPVKRGFGYFWQMSTTLQPDDWDYVPEIIDGDDTMLERNVMPEGDPLHLFARAIKIPVPLGQLRNLDSDGDGFTNQEEFETHSTDPLHKDTDRDGFDDVWDELYFDPLVANDPNANSDGDAFTDGEEYLLGFNPISEFDDALTSETFETTISSVFTIRGRDGDDVITGSVDRFDTIYGDEGNDVITGMNPSFSNLIGGNGNDTLVSLLGFTVLEGGNGNDELRGGPAGGHYTGGRGNDTIIVGTEGTNFHSVDAGPGDDVVEALEGNGLINLGDGDDTLTTGAANDSISVGGFGHNTIHSADGDDQISISGNATASIWSGLGDDRIDTSFGADRIFSGDGSDTISCDDGDDYVDAGDGDDQISAGSNGVMTLLGGGGYDRISGGSHLSVYVGGSDNDSIVTSAGVFQWSFNDGLDSIQAVDENSVLKFGEGITLNDLSFGFGDFTGGDPRAFIWQGWILHRSQEDLRVWISHPSDTTQSGWITVTDWQSNLSKWSLDFTAGGGGIVQGTDIVVPTSNASEGTQQDDILTGTSGDDILSGLEGDDDLSGLNGNDVLIGGTGNNVFRWSWGDGYDYLYVDFTAFFGDDTLNRLVLGVGVDPANVVMEIGNQSDFPGEEVDPSKWEARTPGRDARFIITHPTDSSLSGAIVIHNWDATKSKWSISTGEGQGQAITGVWSLTQSDDAVSGSVDDDEIHGLAGTDTISGLAGADRILGGDGDDVLSGGDGNDRLDGGSGADELDGGEDDDRLLGGDGNDILIGGIGDDRLEGGNGDDVLSGGAGDDSLRGGLGADIYLINPNEGSDTIFENREELITDFRNNIVRFSAGIDPESLSVALPHTFPPSLTIGELDAAGESYIWSVNIRRLDGEAPSNKGAVQARAWDFEFADGTVWNNFNVFDGETTGQFVNVAAPIGGNTYIDGTELDDSELLGTSGNETIFGFAGNDTIDGLAGGDIISGGAGNDILTGGEGDDYLFGGEGDDIYRFDLNSGHDVIGESEATLPSANVIEISEAVVNEGVRLLPRELDEIFEPLLSSNEGINILRADIEPTWSIEIDPDSLQSEWLIKLGTTMTWSIDDQIDRDKELVFVGGNNPLERIQSAALKSDVYVPTTSIRSTKFYKQGFHPDDRVFISDTDGVTWEDLSFIHEKDSSRCFGGPSSSCVAVGYDNGSPFGDFFFLILETEFGDDFPTLIFSDGSHAVWNKLDEAYELNGNFDSDNTTDTNTNGVSDALERYIFGSLQANLDTNDLNANNVPDWWELFYFGALLTANSDTDGDGLEDAAEWELLTNPLESDTDGDGITDGVESMNEDVDPLTQDAENADVDMDGLTGVVESQLGTSDNDPDSDDDGVSDGDEVAAGTDPLDSESKPFNPDVLMGPDLTDTGCENIGNLGIVPDPLTANRYQIRAALLENPKEDFEPERLTWQFRRPGSTSILREFSTRRDATPTYMTFRGSPGSIYEAKLVRKENPRAYGSTTPVLTEPITCPATFASGIPVGACFSLRAEDHLEIDLENVSDFDPTTPSSEIPVYLVPLRKRAWSVTNSGGEAVGARYRKIALNGRPMPDSAPQQESESDMPRELTYVDAFNLTLHHDTSFISIPLAASDLVFEASASVSETTWNNRSTLRPHEQLTLPFGVGWDSNLCSYIEVLETFGNVSDPATLNVIDEGGRAQRFGSSDNLQSFFPWPSSRVDAKTYLNQLSRVGDKFILKKKYGNTLTYGKSDAWFMYSTDRFGSDQVRRHTYWRLEKVTDRYGNSLEYDYGSSNISLIPRTISSPDREDLFDPENTQKQVITIERSDDCRRIDWIVDARGAKTTFNYSTRTANSAFEYVTLDSVDYDDGTTVRYTYEVAVDEDEPGTRPTHYYHANIKTITDKRGSVDPADLENVAKYTHTFNYEYDRTRKSFTSNGGQTSFGSSITQLPPKEQKFARGWLRQQNSTISSTTVETIRGLPRRISSVRLPDDIGSSFFNKTPNTQLRFGPNFSAQSGTVVIDTVGNETHYDFGGMEAERVNRSVSITGSNSSGQSNTAVGVEWMVYYTDLRVHYGGRPDSEDYLGSESLEFDLDSGLSLCSLTDFSGNTTKWKYADKLPSGSVVPIPEQPNFMSRWADPTQKIDALGRTEDYRYSTSFRVMDRVVDVHGTATVYTVDALGRRTDMTVTGADGGVLRKEAYAYTDMRFQAFMTKKTVEAYSSVSGQSWEVPLVTEYVPDLRGRVFQEIVDPDNLALTIEYTYDINNNKLSVKDGRENTTLFSYDSLNRLELVTYPSAGTLSGVRAATKQFLYDFNGNKAAEIDEEGNYKIYHRDALNRVTQMIIDMDGVGLPQPNAVGSPVAGLVPETGRGTAGIADLKSVSEYNAVSSITHLTDARGIITHTDYDVMQRPIHVYGNWEEGDSDVQRAASSEKTHTEYKYLQEVSVGGAMLDANPGATTLAGKGFKPTVTIRHDAVQSTESGNPETFTSYNICDPVYRSILSEVQFKSSGSNFDQNHQRTTVSYGTITNKKESLTTTATDDRNKITISTRDGLQRATSVTDAVGTTEEATTETTYSSTGLVWKVTDALDRESENEYDAAGRLTHAWAPDAITGLVDRSQPASETLGSPLTITEYDDNSNVVKTTNPRGHVWDFDYDTRNRKILEQHPAVTNAENPETPVLNVRPQITTAYNGVGSVISVTDTRDNTARTIYDQAYRPEYVLSNPATGNPSTDPLAPNTHDIVVQSVYDPNSNVVQIVDGNGNNTKNQYDALNRLTATATNPVNGLPNDLDAASAATDIVVRNKYDDSGQLIQVTDGEDQVTAFRYDGLGRKTMTIWDLNAPAVKRIESCVFDGIVKISRLDPNAQATNFDYDGQHRLETVSYVGRAEDDRTYVYDLVGNLKDVTYTVNPLIRNSGQTYDKLNRVLTETSAGRTHTYKYDKAGNRIETTFDTTGRFLDCSYDKLNRLEICTEKVSSSASTGQNTTYEYALNGNITRKTLPNGNYTDCAFDALNRKLSKNTFTSLDVNVVSFDYSTAVDSYPSSYDKVGNVLQIVEDYGDPNVADRTVTNVYDRVYRLDTETFTTGVETTVTDYSYDKANNRSGKTVTVGGTQTTNEVYAYGDTTDTYNSNQLKTVTDGTEVTSFTYDSNGNRISKTLNGNPNPQQTYGFDYDNRLVSVTDTVKGDFAYVYDHRTRRVLRDETAASGQSTQLSFSGGTSAQEIESGVTTVEYIRGSDYGGGIGGVLYTIRGGNRSFNAYNSRGDVVSQTGDTENITWQAAYEAFGTQTDDNGGTNDERQRANTKDEDPTGLLNEHYRYRDLEYGVFITRDPAGFVDGPNVYTYVRQNPWTFFDPLGLQIEGAFFDATGMTQDLQNFVNFLFGGDWSSRSANTAKYEKPKGGLGGVTGGVVRAATLRAVPFEKNPNMASQVGGEIGASQVPVLDPVAQLATGVSVTGIPVSPTEAILGLALDVAPAGIGVISSTMEKSSKVLKAESVLYRKMSSKEANTTLEMQKLQPPIRGTDSSKWLSESEAKVKAFQNAAVSQDESLSILKFIMNDNQWKKIKKASVPQAGSKGSPNIKAHQEGLEGTEQYNYGITKERLKDFNHAVEKVEKAD